MVSVNVAQLPRASETFAYTVFVSDVILPPYNIKSQSFFIDEYGSAGDHVTPSLLNIICEPVPSPATSSIRSKVMVTRSSDVACSSKFTDIVPVGGTLSGEY